MSYLNSYKTTGLTAGGTYSLMSIDPTTNSVTSAFIDYAINNTQNAYRTGIILSSFNASSTTYTELSSPDLIGDTSGLIFSCAIINSNFVISANIVSGTWSVKLAVRML